MLKNNIISLGDVRNEKTLEGISEDESFETAKQIQDKFALPNIPKYICDVKIDAGTHMRIGEVNPLDDWGNGGGIQYDLIGQRVGDFINERPIK